MSKLALAVLAILLAFVGSALLAEDTASTPKKGRVIIQLVVNSKSDSHDYHVHCGGNLVMRKKTFLVVNLLLEQENKVVAKVTTDRNGYALIELPPSIERENGRETTFAYQLLSEDKKLLAFIVVNTWGGVELSDDDAYPVTSDNGLIEIIPGEKPKYTNLTDKEFEAYLSFENFSKRRDTNLRAIAGQK